MFATPVEPLGPPAGFQQAVEGMHAAPDAQARFAVVTQALGELGIDQVNYGFFDPAAASRAEAEVIFLSTMRPDWLSYYYARELHQLDPHVTLIRQGNVLPYRWGDAQVEAITDDRALITAEESREAGLRSALCVPLTGPFDPRQAVAGMTLGSSLNEQELSRRVGSGAPYLTALAHVFHNLSLGTLLREAAGAGTLTPRERECPSFLAAGLRPDRIAERMGLARVTIDLHLANARRRLKARTLAEAVAKAMTYGQLTL